MIREFILTLTITGIDSKKKSYLLSFPGCQDAEYCNNQIDTKMISTKRKDHQ